MRRLCPLVLPLLLLAAPARADGMNLLVDPNFDDDPTMPGNGWVVAGAGSVTYDLLDGSPAAPSARLHASDGQAVALLQCVPAFEGASYDFESYSFTHSSFGGGSNGAQVSFFADDVCAGTLLDTVPTDLSSFPDWNLRQRFGAIAPAGTHSARMELFAETPPGANEDISFDTISLLPEPGGADAAALGALAALAYAGVRRRRA